MRRTGLLLLGAAAAVWGCGAVGPEVRLSPEASTWKPEQAVFLPAVLATDAVFKDQSLPEGVPRIAPDEVSGRVIGAVREALAARSSVRAFPLALTVTTTAAEAALLGRQYLEARAVDPALASRIGAAVGSEALILTAVLRYGPEVEGGVQQMSQSARTQMGTSQVSISSSTTRAIVYYNSQFRCALVRCADGVIVWDAAVRRHQKKVAVLEVTQEGVLRESAEEMVDTFPWARPRPREEEP